MKTTDMIELVDNIRIDCTKDFMTGPYDKQLLDMIAYYLITFYEQENNENITKNQFNQVVKTAKNEILGSWDKVITYLERKCND